MGIPPRTACSRRTCPGRWSPGDRSPRWGRPRWEDGRGRRWPCPLWRRSWLGLLVQDLFFPAFPPDDLVGLTGNGLLGGIADRIADADRLGDLEGRRHAQLVQQGGVTAQQPGKPD